MKALFIGDYNDLTIAFAKKLAKNGIDLAISNKSKEVPNLGFKYTKYISDSSYVLNIYRNFRPDVIVFTASFDDGEYLDLLDHILRSANENKIKRVIYLSSSTVYGIWNETSPPPETIQPEPKSERALRYASGEDICRRWAMASDTIITILRIAGLYGPDTHYAAFNRLIWDLLSGETVTFNTNASVSFLHINDASEAFLQIFDTSFSDIYNISSSQLYAADELRDLICEYLPEAEEHMKIIASAKTECLIADNSLLKKEYTWRERHNIKNDIAAAIESTKQHDDNIKKQDEKKRAKKEKLTHPSPIRTVLGYIETVFLFFILVYITAIQPYIDLIQGIDFIVIYLVLIAIVMNLHQSALSLLLSISLLVYHKTLLGYDVFSTIINSQTLLMAAEYCIVSIAVSYVVQRLKTKNKLLRLELREREHDMDQLQRFSEDNLRTRHFFEDQILEYDLSLPRIISMASRLDTLEPEKIIPETIGIISESIGVNDVAAYFIGKKGGRMRLSHAKTEEAIKLGQSPLLDDLTDMISALNNDEVFVNKTLDEKLPSMASGVKVNGRLIFVITIWNLPFAKMRQYISNLLKSLTTLVSAALRRATRYEELTTEQRYLQGTNVLRSDAFKKLCELRLSDNSFTNVLCQIDTTDDQIMACSKQLEGLIRENDYLGVDSKNNLYVLLSGTSTAGYQVFSKRLIKNGIKSKQINGGIT